MEKYYIKFIEGDKEDLALACKLAEKNGYKKWNFLNTLEFRGTGNLMLRKEGFYYTTTRNELTLINDGYTELKIE